MRHRNSGFTLVELIITMAMIGFVLAGASQMIVGLLRHAKQQGKIAETNIEGIIGLEQLRQDVDTAGYGLPWVIPSGLTYEEASDAESSLYNDAPASGTTGTNNNPRAILSGNGTGIYGFDDILVLKAASLARNDTCQKWTYLKYGNVPQTWNVGTEDLAAGDNVIVLSPGATETTRRTLVVDKTDATTWQTTFNSTVNFAPPDASEVRFIYGIGPTVLRMPFNRADYYISSDSAFVPKRCAPNTGVLVKSMISHSNGQWSDSVLLLDCVADIQVVFRLDTNADGLIDTTSEDITALNAQQVRNQVKEVYIYILSHEGQKDREYVHDTTSIYVGDTALGGGHTYDIGANVNYRWKVYTLSVRPHNLN